MKISAAFWLLAALLSAASSFSRDQMVKKYFEDGDTLQLSPRPVSEKISSIVWYCDEYLLAEWVKDLIELRDHISFKGRTTLNTDTGVLEIRNTTAADAGVYSVEINNRVQSRVHQAVRIKAVKPLANPLSPSSSSSTAVSDDTETEPLTKAQVTNGV